MFYKGQEAGIEVRSPGGSVSPIQNTYIVFSLVLGVIIVFSLFAGNIEILKLCLSYLFQITVACLIIYSLILIFKPELMNSWHLFIKFMEKHYYGDSSSGQVEENEILEVFQPEEIDNLAKANIAPKVEVGK